MTGEDVLSVLPFNNTVDLVEVSGASLLTLLEWSLAGLCPGGICETEEFYQVAGLRYQVGAQ